jgi:hypothetical protein
MIDLSRRALLQGIVAGTVLVGLNSPALALVPDRYRELIEAQREAIRLTRVFEDIEQRETGQRAVIEAAALSTARDRDGQPYRWWKHAVMQDIGLVKAMNDVLVVLNTRFNEPVIDERAARKRVFQLLEGEITIDTLSDGDLRQYEDYLVNVATARNLLMRWNVPMNGQLCPDWAKFVSRLKNVLADA